MRNSGLLRGFRRHPRPAKLPDPVPSPKPLKREGPPPATPGVGRIAQPPTLRRALGLGRRIVASDRVAPMSTDVEGVFADGPTAAAVTTGEPGELKFEGRVHVGDDDDRQPLVVCADVYTAQVHLDLEVPEGGASVSPTAAGDLLEIIHRAALVAHANGPEYVTPSDVVAIRREDLVELANAACAGWSWAGAGELGHDDTKERELLARVEATLGLDVTQ